MFKIKIEITLAKDLSYLPYGLTLPPPLSYTAIFFHPLFYPSLVALLRCIFSFVYLMFCLLIHPLFAATPACFALANYFDIIGGWE
jgi:hypothetical protein